MFFLRGKFSFYSLVKQHQPRNVVLASLVAAQESSLFPDSDPAAVIAAELKRTPGAGRERVIDPDNLTSPACAPETYGGSVAGAGGYKAKPNPVTGVWPKPDEPVACV